MKNQVDTLLNQEPTIHPSFSIHTENLSKRFNREWIFRNLTHHFQSGNTYAITGPNGSGKSTLLQILWGQIPPTSGVISYQSKGSAIDLENSFKHLSIATPYMDLIEEFTLLEQLQFHFTLRNIRPGLTLEDVIQNLYFSDARDKQIINFSSGMRQRLKLGLAFYTEANALFLDEPGTNLDAKGFSWYKQTLEELPQAQLVIIASNQPNEYPENAGIINLADLK